MRLLVLSDAFGRQVSEGATYADEAIEATNLAPRTRVPSIDELDSYDTAVVVGGPEAHDVAVQLGGILTLAAERGLCVGIAYHARLDGSDLAVVNRLATVATHEMPQMQQIVDAHPAFRSFFTAFSMGYSGLTDMPEGSTPLGFVGSAESRLPAAFFAPYGDGSLYVVPFHRVESLPQTVSGFIQALTAHRQGDGALRMPAFLEGLRLPGEQELLEEIDQAQADIDAKRARADELARFRLLLGPTTGDQYESLVIDALNLIMNGTEVRAEDREDVGREDFWLVEGESDAALAEAKGIGSHIRRRDVSQVEQHRADLDHDPDELPGLLVVNVFRGSDDLSQRALPVASEVIRQGVRLNVLILRSLDLFNLLAMKLRGEDAASVLDGGSSKRRRMA